MGTRVPGKTGAPLIFSGSTSIRFLASLAIAYLRLSAILNQFMKSLIGKEKRKRLRNVRIIAVGPCANKPCLGVDLELLDAIAKAPFSAHWHSYSPEHLQESARVFLAARPRRRPRLCSTDDDRPGRTGQRS